MKKIENKRELTEAEEYMVTGGAYGRFSLGEGTNPEERDTDKPRDGGATGGW